MLVPALAPNRLEPPQACLPCDPSHFNLVWEWSWLRPPCQRQHSNGHDALASSALPCLINVALSRSPHRFRISYDCGRLWKMKMSASDFSVSTRPPSMSCGFLPK
eukprot:279297-Chlamydomonas_euryale.AAC.10